MNHEEQSSSAAAASNATRHHRNRRNKKGSLKKDYTRNGNKNSSNKKVPAKRNRADEYDDDDYVPSKNKNRKKSNNYHGPSKHHPAIGSNGRKNYHGNTHKNNKHDNTVASNHRLNKNKKGPNQRIPRGLKKCPTSATVSASHKEPTKTTKSVETILKWETNYRPIPLEAEKAILPIIMQYGKRENGMFKFQKIFRLKKVKKACSEYNIRLDQALSLRRHHIVYNNPFAGMDKLGLGSFDDIRGSSRLFEKALEMYLIERNINFLDEDRQKELFYKRRRENKKSNMKMPPTPDCLLENTTTLLRKINADSTNTKKSHRSYSKASFEINWIDAKMFYGASSIELGTKNAVGSLLATAKKYVASYGPGAFVFFNGYGDELEKLLEKEGVFLLDAQPLELDDVREHQRSWCANSRGEVLP